MEQTNSITTEIVICAECEGSGAVLRRVSVDEDESFKCDSCDGSGTLVKQVETKYFAYKPDPTLPSRR